jgi:hypothetical protein
VVSQIFTKFVTDLNKNVMNVYVNEQAKVMIEKWELNSCGVFQEEDSSNFIGWYVDYFGVLDADEFSSFKDALLFATKLR